MNNNCDELEKCSSRTLFTALVRRLFEKKAVRLAVSAVAVIISLFILNITSDYYCSPIWWANYLFNLPVSVMFTAGVGGFVSNIGRFSVWKFTVATTASGIVMWVLMSVYCVIAGADLPIDWALCLPWIGLRLLQHMPMHIISLAIVILPMVISAHVKNKR